MMGGSESDETCLPDWGSLGLSPPGAVALATL
jgi:hypothetical protein